VKRKFRVPGQVFAESIGNLIAFIEANPLAKASELGTRMLGVEGEPTPEQKDRVARTQGDLIWLVREGYVTEFIDGGLYAPPAMVEARKKEVEAEEVDPENFPEAPRAPQAASQAAPAAEVQVPAPAPDLEAAAPADAPAEAPAVHTETPAAPAPEAAVPADAPAQIPAIRTETPPAPAPEAPAPAQAPAVHAETPAAPAAEPAPETPPAAP
jgi:hypothetical protein